MSVLTVGVTLSGEGLGGLGLGLEALQGLRV